MGAKRKNHTTQVDKRYINSNKISDIDAIRSDALKHGLNLTLRKWKSKYDLQWIEDVIFFRSHKSILPESSQYEADLD